MFRLVVFAPHTARHRWRNPRTRPMTLLHDGPLTRRLSTDTPHVEILRFKETPTAFNAERRAVFAGKAELSNRIASMVFRFLEERGVASYYLDTVNKSDMRVRALTAFPVELLGRNVVAGSLSRRLGLPEGTRLARPITEVYYQNEELGDPLLTDEHIAALKLLSPAELAEQRRLALLANTALKELWDRAGLTLVDVSLRFGVSVDGQVLLGGALTPDTMTIWEPTGDHSGAESFRRAQGDLIDSYQSLYDRLIDAWPSLKLDELVDPPA